MNPRYIYPLIWMMIIFGFDPANLLGAFMTLTNVFIPGAETKLLWNEGNHVVVLTNSPWSFNRGLTMGHVVALSFDEEKEPGTFQHELAHVEQHNVLGPLYLSMHLATKVSCYYYDGPAWDCDFLEFGPYSTPPVPFKSESNVIVLRIEE